MEGNAFLSPSNIVSTLCRKGEGEAGKIFENRLKKIQDSKIIVRESVHDGHYEKQNMVSGSKQDH